MKNYVSPAKHFTVAALALLTASAAHAQTWNGGGTDNNWSTPANWTGGAPANNGTATVNFTTGTRPTSNVDTAWNINTISITYSGNRTIQGSDITFTQSGASSTFINANTSASGTQTIDNNLIVNNTTAASAVKLGGGNNMAAALILNGNLTIGGNATTLSTLNYSNQNVTINGRIIDSSSANVTLSAPGGNLRLTNAANNFRGGIVLGSDNSPASLTVTSISNSGVSSAIGNGPDIRFGVATNTSAVTHSLIVESASGGSMNRNLLIYPANNTAGLTAKIVSAVAGQTVTIVGQAYNYGGVGNAHLELAGVGNGTFSGRINTVKDVTKSDSGTWTLSGSTNAFTGNTTVNAGTLIVSGTGTINTSAGVGINGSTSRLKYDSSVALSRNVSVTVGGTFAYNSSGSYAGALTLTNGKLAGTNWSGTLNNLSVGANQTISPGNSPGTASTGDQTWAGGGSYVWEINNATGTAGADPGWDLLNGTGSLTISANSGSKFNILITSLTTGNVAGNASNFNGLTTDYKWKIADFANAITFDATAFALDPSAFSNTVVGGNPWAITRGDASGIGGDNTQLWVTYSIPEPSTWLLMAGSLAALAVLRRRRKLN